MDNELIFHNIDLDYIRRSCINSYLNKQSKEDDLKDSCYEKIDLIIEKNKILFSIGGKILWIELN